MEGSVDGVDGRSKPSIIQDFLAEGTRSKLLFIVALSVNVGIYLFGGIYISAALMERDDVFVNDFYQNFMPAVGRLIHEPANLYVPGVAPFRHLPGALLYYLPFYFIPDGYRLNHLLFSTSVLAWNLGTAYLVFLVSKTCGLDRQFRHPFLRSSWTWMSLYLLTPLHWLEYSHGQTNVISGFFVLLGVYLYMKGRKHYSSLVFSIAVTFKILAIFPLIFTFGGKNLKDFFKNVVFLVAGQITNIILFLVYPFMLFNYLSFNVNTSSTFINEFLSGSSNIARNIIMLDPAIPFIPVLLIVFLAIFPFNFYISRCRAGNLTVLDKLMLSYVVSALVFPDLVLVHSFIHAGTFVVFAGTRSEHFTLKNKFFLSLPTLSVLAWELVPFTSIFFIISLVMFDVSYLRRNPPGFFPVLARGRKEAGNNIQEK